MAHNCTWSGAVCREGPNGEFILMMPMTAGTMNLLVDVCPKCGAKAPMPASITPAINPPLGLPDDASISPLAPPPGFGLPPDEASA